MQTVFPPSQDSIFGDTYQGVPNPQIAHRHPYPTRYHGPNWTVPGVAQNTWSPNTYAQAPYLGVGAAGDAAPLFQPVTGSSMLDSLLGTALGYVAAPKEADRPMWMLVGGLAAYAMGTAGLLSLGGALFWAHNKR